MELYANKPHKDVHSLNKKNLNVTNSAIIEENKTF